MVGPGEQLSVESQRSGGSVGGDFPPLAPARTLDCPLQRFQEDYGGLNGIEGTGQGMLPTGEDPSPSIYPQMYLIHVFPDHFEGHPVLISSVGSRGSHATPTPQRITMLLSASGREL